MNSRDATASKKTSENPERDPIPELDYQNKSCAGMSENATTKGSTATDSSFSGIKQPLYKSHLSQEECLKNYPLNSFELRDENTSKKKCDPFGSDYDSDSSNQSQNDTEDTTDALVNRCIGTSNFALTAPKLQYVPFTSQTELERNNCSTSENDFKGQNTNLQIKGSCTGNISNASCSEVIVGRFAEGNIPSTELSSKEENNSNLPAMVPQDIVIPKEDESNQDIEGSKPSEDISEKSKKETAVYKKPPHVSFREIFKASSLAENSHECLPKAGLPVMTGPTTSACISVLTMTDSSNINIKQEPEEKVPVIETRKEAAKSPLVDVMEVIQDVKPISTEMPKTSPVSSLGSCMDESLSFRMRHEKNVSVNSLDISGAEVFYQHQAIPHKVFGNSKFENIYTNNKRDDLVDTSESSTPTYKPLSDHLDTELLAENLRQLGIQQLLQDSFCTFYSRFQNYTAVTRPKYYHDLENLYSHLKTNVSKLEHAYEEYVCLPPDSLKMHLWPLENTQTNSLGYLPSEVQEAYQQLCENLIQQYEDRNAKITACESQAMESLLNKSNEYYAHEMDYIMGDNYFDSDTFQKYSREIREETISIFLKVADFKHYFWINKYKSTLEKRLKITAASLENRNHENKRQLESMMQKAMADTVQEYKNSLVKEKYFRDFNPKALNTLEFIGNDAKEAALQYFQQQYSKFLITKNLGAIEIINRCQRELEMKFDAIFAFEVDDVKIKQEAQNRLFKLQEKQAITGTDKYFRAYPADSVASTLRHSNTKASSKFNHGQEIPRPPRSWPLISLPQCQLAIHFGLNRTLAGIVTPGTDDVLVLCDVSNCIYFDHPQLLLGSEDPACSKYKASKISSILETRCNLPQAVIIENTKRFMRLEEMIACLFTAIKLKTELDHKVDISNCVICIPQCLNENQRRVIFDGARIAGFGDIIMISDTNSIALAFMVEREVIQGSFMIGNTSEGLVDAAYCTFDHGMVYCPGVSGEFFSKKGEPGRLCRFLAHFGIEYDQFRQTILRIFKGYMRKKNESVNLKKHPALQGIVLAGHDKYFINRLYVILNSDSHLNQREVEHIQLNENYALFGAAYLTELNDFNRAGPIYKRWEALSNDPDSDLVILKRYLLEQNLKDEILTATNPSTGGNLSEQEIRDMQRSFFLNERIQLHKARMTMLKKADYLETCVKMKPGLGLNELHDVIASICKDMETLELTTEQLCEYDNNLDSLFDKVCL